MDLNPNIDAQHLRQIYMNIDIYNIKIVKKT